LKHLPVNSRSLSSSLEFSTTLDAAPDHESLKAIATSTGGKVVSTHEGLLNEIEAYVRKSETHFTEERRSPLWATPYAMVAVLGFLVGSGIIEGDGDWFRKM